MKRQRLIVLACFGATSGLLIISLAFFWLGHSSTTFANLKSESSNVPDQLPKHPLEQMGIAGLSPSIGMPDNAIPEAQAIDIFTEYTWGPYRDKLVKKYPPSVIPAVYSARESVMGPSARERPVWVVALEGWGRPAPCHVGLPSNPEEDGCIPVKTSAYAIVDAVAGQILGSWHYGTRGGQ